jgi:mycothiol synthase
VPNEVLGQQDGRDQLGLIVRPYEADDANAYVDYLNATGVPTTIEEFLERAASSKAVFTRLVAEEDGAIVGNAIVQVLPDLPEDTVWCTVRVAEARRGRGVGTALLEALAETELARGKALRAQSQDGDPATLAWAERRGFRLLRHTLLNLLDLAAFDEAAHAGRLERVAEQGVRIVSLASLLAEAGDDAAEALWDRVHSLWAGLLASTPDHGGEEDSDPERLRGLVRDHPATSPEGILIAERQGEWLGLTHVWTHRPDRFHVPLTGVRPEFQGRGLATALKVAGIAFARRSGAAVLSTNNDAGNTAILAVNERLGFRRESGEWILERPAVSLGVIGRESP